MASFRKNLQGMLENHNGNSNPNKEDKFTGNPETERLEDEQEESHGEKEARFEDETIQEATEDQALLQHGKRKKKAGQKATWHQRNC